MRQPGCTEITERSCPVEGEIARQTGESLPPSLAAEISWSASTFAGLARQAVTMAHFDVLSLVRLLASPVVKQPHVLCLTLPRTPLVPYSTPDMLLL